VSCEYQNPAFRFSNFYESPAENIAKAIDKNDTEGIRTEILEKKVNINFKDEKYEMSLLSLAIVNNKRKSFDELLKLGANPNIENTYCGNPLNSAITYNKNCDLYYIKRLLNYGADITPRLFEKCNFFSHDPIIETIHNYSDEEKVECGLSILKVLTSKLDNPDLLFMYNNAKNYQANIVYNCLSTQKNISALKYLIVDLKYKFPKKIFIDGWNSHPKSQWI
jgi:ankyrin repeat protein